MNRLLVILSLFLTFSVQAANSYGNIYYDGLWYTILDDEAKTCKTASGKFNPSTPGNYVSGDIVIPSVVYDDDTEYTYTVTEIGQLAFYGRTGLTSIIIPNTVAVIGRDAFSGCSGLQTINIPNSVKEIGIHAFDGCSALKNINVDDDNQSYASIDGVLFNRDCTTLIQYPPAKTDSHYEVPASVSLIEMSALSNCKKLTEIVIPESVTQIGYEAFSNCTGLESITIPESVSGLGMAAFRSCSNLNSVVLPSGLTRIEDSTFSGCSSLKSIDIPASVTYIGSSAFYGCSNLAKVMIPNSVTSIGSTAFKNCTAMTTLSIGLSVSSIGYDAFSTCVALNRVYSYALTPAYILYKNVFSGIGNCTLYVPFSTADAYANNGWTFFNDIIEMPASLTLRYSGKGEVLVNGERTQNGANIDGINFDCIILPADGYRIQAVLQDGEEVTSQIANHHLNITNIISPIELDVVFVKDEAEIAYATLTVKNGHVHGAKHHYLAGTAAKIELQPEEGWSVHSVTLNGEDVTERLINNELTTEPLEGENSLDVVYKQDAPDAITGTEASALKVQVHGRTVTVGGKAEGDIVRIYDTKGVLLYAGTDSSIVLSGYEQCVFISINGETFKAALR